LGFFMSNARAQQESVPFVQAVPPMPPIPSLPAMPALTVLPVPAPTVRLAAPAPPAPPAPPLPSAQPTVVLPVLQIPSPAPLPPPVPPLALSIELQKLNLSEGDRWVFFKGNDVIVHANSDDEGEARRARRSFSGDLLWFKLDGKTYVTQDRETMNRVEAAGSSGVLLEATVKQVAISQRLEDGQEEIVMAQRRVLRDVQFSLQELEERLRNIDGNAANQPSLNDARARLEAVAAQNARLQAMLAQSEAAVRSTEAAVRSMQTQMQALELAKRTAELESRRDLDILRGAVSSGKAQPAP
jgi:hypothetical protein